MASEVSISENLCDITIKRFFTVSKIGRVGGGGGSTIKGVFAAWRSSAMAMKIGALESARRVLTLA